MLEKSMLASQIDHMMMIEPFCSMLIHLMAVFPFVANLLSFSPQNEGSSFVLFHKS